MNGRFISLCLAGFILIIAASCSQEIQEVRLKDYPIEPIAFTEVRITDSFWLPRIETNRQATIPYAIKMCEETGRINNLRKAAGLMEGAYEGKRFNDSDVFKVMEGVSYSLANHPDPQLEKWMDEMVEILAQAQEEDGYLYSARTVDPANAPAGSGDERWKHLTGSHELYNVGHMYEAAVAYYRTTGKRKFLDIALKNAELIASIFGPDKRHDRPGHQEIEIGLVKLFRVTEDSRFLNLAKFFLDQRGGERASELYPVESPLSIYNEPKHMQDHIPVLEQKEAVGHAVRAAYMYAGMADVAALSGDSKYLHAIETIWKDVVGKKLYLTGGIGAVHDGEAFGPAYYLPNDTAYAETCASIGNTFWNYRMFLLTGKGKYLDLLERTLYNGLISGVNLEGNRFFYQNPLSSRGGVERQKWFETSCCPVNMLRFLPSLPGYIYARKGDTLFVNLYIDNQTSLEINGTEVDLVMKTSYPWDGDISLSVTPARAGEFELAIRIPGWVLGVPVSGDLYSYTDPGGGFEVMVNGEVIQGEIEEGFLRIRRQWSPGDQVRLALQMPVRKVQADDRVEADAGRIAIERGPLVYCLEEVDAAGAVDDLSFAADVRFEKEHVAGLLGGITVLKTTTFRDEQPVEVRMIPYHLWGHRGAGAMAVWLKKR